MSKNYNFLTLGRSCKPAEALRILGYREYALPFDWVASNIKSIEKCFKDGFKNYHINLRLDKFRTRLIDSYGFEFPHDYPTVNENISEYVQEYVISEKWREYYSINLKKYARRIERFLEIVRSKKPIIVLCEYTITDVKILRSLLVKYYGKTNVFFINSVSSYEEEKINDYNIINIYTEKNGVWNDIKEWKPIVDRIISQIPSDIVFD